MPARRMKSPKKEKKSDTHTEPSRVALEDKVKMLEERLAMQRREFENVAHGMQKLRLRETMLDQVVHMLGRPDRPLDNLQAVLDLCLEAIPAEAGSVLLHDAANQELYFSVASGPVARGIKDFRIPSDQGIAGACFTTKEIISVSDVDRDPRFHKAMSRALGFKTTSLLAVPIVHRGDARGVIEVLNRKDGDHFTAEEIESLKLLARVAGSMLSIFEQLGGGGR